MRRQKPTIQEKSTEMIGVGQEMSRLNSEAKKSQADIASLVVEKKNIVIAFDIKTTELADLEAQCATVIEKLKDVKKDLSAIQTKKKERAQELKEKKTLVSDATKKLKVVQFAIQVATNNIAGLDVNLEKEKINKQKEMNEFISDLVLEKEDLEDKVNILDKAVALKEAELIEKTMLLRDCAKRLSVMAENVKIEQERQKQVLEAQGNIESVKDQIIEENLELSLVMANLEKMRVDKKDLELEMFDLHKEKAIIVKERIALVEVNKQIDRKKRRVEGLYDKAGVKYDK